MFCIPKCDLACVNANCVAPNVCVCQPGFEKPSNHPDHNTCIPFCPYGCQNGECTAPSFCTCNPGYTKRRSLLEQGSHKTGIDTVESREASTVTQ
ncbi:hypothetical protein NQ317_008958, partial [Molorchus minor]